MELENHFSLYPNPTSDIVNVKGDRNIQKTTLLDINGGVVNHEFSNNQISVDQLESGLYFLEILHDDGVEVLRFFKH